MKSVTSNFPLEANVTYKYGGDGKRRERSSPYAAYKWDAGWNMINMENSLGGTLRATYVFDPGVATGNILAHISGSDPASGTYKYYLNDIIGSVRRVRTATKSSLAYYEYTPYGDVYRHTGNGMRLRFTGKEWDDDAQMYYFPFRYYSSGIARWITRDPSGMVDGPNVYAYVGANPVKRVDPLGLVPTFPAFEPDLFWLPDSDRPWYEGRYSHGNWCGRGRSGGGWYLPSERHLIDWHTAPTDRVDKCCRAHDFRMQHRPLSAGLIETQRKLRKCLEKIQCPTKEEGSARQHILDILRRWLPEDPGYWDTGTYSIPPYVF